MFYLGEIHESGYTLSARKNRAVSGSSSWKRSSYVALSTVVVTALLAPLSPANAQELPPDVVEQLSQLTDSGSEPSPAWVVADVLRAESTEAPADPSPTAARNGSSRLAGGPAGIGALPYFGFHGIDLWGGTSAGVNLANGNLYVSSNDLSLNAPGVSTQLTRHYNSQESASNSLGTWASQHGQDVGLQIASDLITFHGPSGFYQDFTLVNGAWIAPAGLNAELVADGAGWKITFVRTGEQMLFSSAGVLLKDVDRNGIGTSYGYSNGALSSLVDAAGRQTTISTTGATTVYTTPDGRRLEYVKNSAGQLQSVALKTTSITSMSVDFEYNDAGKLSWMSTPDNFNDATNGTQFIYDAQNRVIEVLQKFDRNGSNNTRSTKFEYSTGSAVVVDPSNERSTFTLDSSGRITQAMDQLGRVRSQEWTANSDVSSALSSSASGGPASTPTTFDFDNGNNLTKATLPTGAAATFAYATDTSCPDAQAGNPNRPKCATDPAGNRTSMTYDQAGNQLTSSKQGPTGVEASTYLRETTDRSICGAFAGNICKVTDPAGAITTLSYDNDGNVIQIDAPLGRTTYVYDGMSRLISVTDPAGDVTTYSLNAKDQIRTTSITRAGQTRVITNTTPFDKSIANTYADSNFASNQLESLRRGAFYGNPAGRFFRPTPANYLSQAPYTDANGNLTRLFSDFGDTTASNTYSYNSANQLTSIASDGSQCTDIVPATAGQDCISLGYDYRGREIKRVFPGGATRTMDWDGSDRPLRVTVKDRTGAIINDVSYNYATTAGADQALIQSKTSHKEPGISAGAVTTYLYDYQQRLTSATERLGANVQAAWNYSYDSRGNRTQQVLTGQTGAAAGTTTYSYDAANKLTSTSANTTGWAHDSAGNLTSNPAKKQNYSYGPALELKSITTANTTDQFTYWGNGNTGRTTAGDTTERADLSGVIRTNTGNNTTDLTRSPAGEILSTTTNGITQFFVTDRQGSVIAMLDEAGNTTANYSYDPYGNERTTTGAAAEGNKYRYLGEKLDTSGLYKFGARYYDPTLGRFTQQDPSGQNPHYTYAGNNPINASDRSGLDFWNDFGNTFSPALIGGVIIGLGAVASLLIKSTGVGILATAGVGCLAGLASTAVGDGLTGNESGVGGYAGACAGGAAAGAFGFGFGKLGVAAIK